MSAHIQFGDYSVNPAAVTYAEWDHFNLVIRVHTTSCCAITLPVDHEHAEKAAKAFGLGEQYDAWDGGLKAVEKAKATAEAAAEKAEKAELKAEAKSHK